MRIVAFERKQCREEPRKIHDYRGFLVLGEKRMFGSQSLITLHPYNPSIVDKRRGKEIEKTERVHFVFREGKMHEVWVELIRELYADLLKEKGLIHAHKS